MSGATCVLYARVSPELMMRIDEYVARERVTKQKATVTLLADALNAYALDASRVESRVVAGPQLSQLSLLSRVESAKQASKLARKVKPARNRDASSKLSRKAPARKANGKTKPPNRPRRM